MFKVDVYYKMFKIRVVKDVFDYQNVVDKEYVYEIFGVKDLDILEDFVYENIKVVLFNNVDRGEQNELSFF